MAKSFNNVGKLCPLCKKGIMLYVKVKGGFFLETTHVEYTSCSNKKCDAFVKIT